MRVSIGFALCLMATTPLAAQEYASRSVGVDSTAILRSGDIVHLQIWREPDLSGDFTVDEQGVATFPKIGPVRVGSQSAGSLKVMLVDSYGVFLRNPSIEVVLLRRVQVLGAVRNPGLYTVDPTMTVADALAKAGGVAEDGKSGEVYLLRDDERIKINLSQRTRIADTAIRSGDQLYVPQRTWIARNPAAFAGVLTATAGIIVTLMAR